MPKTSLRPHQRPEDLDTTIDYSPASPTPAKVTHAASQSITYDPTVPMLLGTFGADHKRGAVVRLPNGRVNTVTVGDSVAGDVVVAIADGTMVLNHRGRARRLAIPGTV